MPMRNPQIPVIIRSLMFPPVGSAFIAWHEELGSANKTIEVPASGDIAVNFTSADFKKRANDNWLLAVGC